MIDTHTHIYFKEDYKEEISDVVDRMLKEGVSHVILPNVNMESLDEVKEFHYSFPEISTMAIGLHPTEVKDDWRDVLANFKEELRQGDYKAIGETGIDLHWETENLQQQKEAFEHQLSMAEQSGLPVIIHSRDALEETLDSISKMSPSVPLIFHSFTGGKEAVKRIREICDPFFGINGVVTYKNAPELREALKEISTERILLETDAPYLTPVPFRGRRNETSFIGFVRDKIGETLLIHPSEIEEITDRNARQLFRL